MKLFLFYGLTVFRQTRSLNPMNIIKRHAFTIRH